ncbi:arginyl-tRNA synthetase [Acanthamoeba polyphaga mimivirus]|nr:arginyl-tRNA synthetase [Mimivirus reunion]WMV62037.1 arginyl-tRNA synthetase [Mimivirus sp.]WMV63014.1 arginyl-tRNA synthetase [Acanthamoeba polyphaga mimivirus]WMV63991.1 arginyl-tRNA synthetase [Mimivirus sp.]
MQDNLIYLANCFLNEAIKTTLQNLNKVNIIDTPELYSFVKGINTDYQFNKSTKLANDCNLDQEKIVNELITQLKSNSFFENISSVELQQNKSVKINGKKTNTVIKQIMITLNISKLYLSNRINLLYKRILSGSSIYVPNTITKKIIVDYSSPNIAKEMHIGHLRSTIIGESICRVLEMCGHDVYRINHVGDWGTQFGMLIAYIKNNQIESYTISELMNIYKESRKLFESSIDFKNQSRLETVSLQNGNIESITIWQKIHKISMNSFHEIYSLLGINNLITKGESFYQDQMTELVNSLTSDNKITVENDMKLMFVEGISKPFILQKSDGGFTYDTSDLTALKYRLFIEKADHIIYVVDSSQQEHFSQMFQIAEKLDWIKNQQLQHIGFGLVLGSDGSKLKTRSGETIKLQDVIDNVVSHASNITRELIKQKNLDWNDDDILTISKKIAINCIKYSDLNNPRLNNYKFDINKMLNSKGNTAVYLMYGLARCKSILRKVPNNTILNGDIIIENENSRNLLLHVLKYVEMIDQTVETMCPHYLCIYLYDLIGSLTKFYTTNRCLEYDNDNLIGYNANNLRIVNMVKIIISKIFELIGLEEIEQL